MKDAQKSPGPSRNSFRLKRTQQCVKCPWRVSTNPRDIPNGYCETRHKSLKNTIAVPANLADLNSPVIRMMACHEEHASPCVGWLANQLGPGNNLALRLHMMQCENAGDLSLRGKQHASFEDTLPREAGQELENGESLCRSEG